jgi:hypothetical protein
MHLSKHSSDSQPGIDERDTGPLKILAISRRQHRLAVPANRGDLRVSGPDAATGFDTDADAETVDG